MNLTKERGPVLELLLDAAGMVCLALMLGWSVAMAQELLGGTAGDAIGLVLMGASIIAFVALLRDVVRQIRRIADEIMKNR